MDAAIPADAQNAPTGIWKSRTEREIPTAPTPIIVVVNERKNNGDSNSVAKPSTESDQAQIQTETSSSGGDLPTILRKCKILAARLGSEEFARWITWELDGYSEYQPVPPYRQIAVQCYADFMSAAWNAPQRPILWPCAWEESEGSVRTAASV